MNPGTLMISMFHGALQMELILVLHDVLHIPPILRAPVLVDTEGLSLLIYEFYQETEYIFRIVVGLTNKECGFSVLELEGHSFVVPFYGLDIVHVDGRLGVYMCK